MPMKLRVTYLFLPFVALACSADAPPSAPAGLDALAGEYLYLELSMGLHDDAHVDAWFG